MTIHTDISEIIGKCRRDLTLEASFSSGGYSINFYTGRLRPEVQPLTLFHGKGTPLVYLLLTNVIPLTYVV